MKKYLLGNMAIAKGLQEIGTAVVAGYPGTPSSEIIESLASLKEIRPIHIEWSVNEKVALEVAIGASWTGSRAAVTMKHVGLNVAADPFMTLAYLGVGGGLAIIVADDPFCHSSQNEQDSRRYAQFAAIPCLDPSDPGEAKEMAKYAFSLSERLNVPVMLRPTTRVSHARSDVEVSSPEEIHLGSGFVKNPPRRVALPGHVRPLHVELLDKQKIIEEELAGAPWNRLIIRGDHGVIASGISSLYAEEAIQDLELDLSFLKLGTLPVPSETIRKMIEHVSKVLVVEELDPVVEEQVEKAARIYNPKLEIFGKESGHIPKYGELDILTVRNAIASMESLASRAGPKLEEAHKILPPRPPGLCPGCSHRATYYAIRKAFGKKAIFPSDIGCYTMAVPMGTVDTCLCMGASITLASGIRFGGEEKGICCSLGDSTFLHGGMTGLLNATYNQAKITVAILDNSTTAMTGHQPHPGTGFTASGEKTVPISLEAICKALGAGSVETTNPYDLDKAVEAFQRARDYPGLSVVIAKQECVITARRHGRKAKAFRVNDNCIGCKSCIDFGCPAIELENETAKINSQCTGCGVCARICPSSAIEVVK